MCEHVCRTVNDHIAIRVTPFRLMESLPLIQCRKQLRSAEPESYCLERPNCRRNQPRLTDDSVDQNHA